MEKKVRSYEKRIEKSETTKYLSDNRDNEKPDIYLLTWNGSENYGTNLQAYALKVFIEKLGYNCFMFSGSGRMTPKIFWNKATQIIKNHFNKFFRVKKPNNVYSEKTMIKREKIHKYLEENFNYIKINTKNELKKIAKQSIFLVGSDQVWNPYYLDSSALLDFLPDDYIRCSYAASVGIDSIPVNMRNLYKLNLSKFSSITVREESSKRALKEFMPTAKIETVMDPTFLLDASDWDNFAKQADFFDKQLIPQDFILCYFVGNQMDYSNQINMISEKLKCLVFQVDESNDGFNTKYGVPIPEAGPVEFVWLIQHAKMILTDSFHAVALSVNLQKEFIVFKRFQDDDIHSQNGRIEDVLKTLGLSSQMYNRNHNILSIIEENIDYSNVSIRRNNECQKSMDILKKMIKKG